MCDLEGCIPHFGTSKALTSPIRWLLLLHGSHMDEEFYPSTSIGNHEELFIKNVSRRRSVDAKQNFGPS